MRDFEDEISGYLGNRRIAELLKELPLAGGVDRIPADMRLCYAALAKEGFVGQEEIALLDAWLDDLASGE